jgi:hypothetical protein
MAQAEPSGERPSWDMPHVKSLDDLAALVVARGREPGQDLYVRWSEGPAVDLAGGGTEQSSRDALTGVLMPGLSANSLRAEPWWDDRPLRLWLARRLHDYRHLAELHGPGVQAWVLAGQERGRGPDNEPLVVCCEPLGWVDESALAECDGVLAEHGAGDWGPLDRRT